MKTSIVSLIAVALIMAVPCAASDLKMRKSILYPPSSVILQEEFASGGTASGSIGALGFGLGGGTVSGLVSEANRPGILQIDTSAVSGTIARIQLYASSTATPNQIQEILWITRLNTNDANTTVRIGVVNSTGTSPPNNGIYFEKLDGDANWFCVTRSGGTETRNDSTVAVNTNFTTFYFRANSTGVSFSINNVSVCPVHTTNITGTYENPTVQIVNSAAASKTIDIDYFQMKSLGITR